jgi:hypothetical protein
MRYLAALVLILPVFAFAQTTQEKIDALLKQISDLQSQLKTQSATGVESWASAPGTIPASAYVCPSFTRTLQRGSEGSDVTELQKILASGKFLTAEPTGYFGGLTEKGLGDFQVKSKLLPATAKIADGLGVFGPKTRAFFAKLCADEITRRTTPVTVSVPACVPASATAPSESCGGEWRKIFDSKSCHVGWQCFVASAPNAGTNRAPLISGIDGPTTLSVGSAGAWTVNASDPEGGALKYSVIWGDEGAGSILSVLAGVQNPTRSSSSKLVHAYAAPGSFSFGVTVYDPAGNTASGRFTVAITARGSGEVTVSPPVQTATAGSCFFANQTYAEGTETEGYNINDLCLATNKVCLNRASYIPKYRCTAGIWKEIQTNPFPGLPNYANMVGTQCAPIGSLQRGRTTSAVVHPATLLCRDSLCATTQNFAQVSLTCEYEIWVDWGIFSAGATTTGACAEPTPCEYHYGQGGKACASKQNGACPVPKGGHPLGT